MPKRVTEKESSSDDEQEEVYEVRRIKKHERRKVEGGGKLPDGRTEALYYKVAWEGYPNKDDDTWEIEDNVNDNAQDAIEHYWTKVDPEKRYQRYESSTAKHKAGAKRASIAGKAPSSSGTPAKKKARTSTKTVEISDEDDEEEEAPASKKRASKSRQSNGSAKASGSKKAKKAQADSDEDEDEDEDETPAPKKRGRPPQKKKAEPEPEAEEEEEEEANDVESAAAAAPVDSGDVEMDERDSFDANHNYTEWETTKYAKIEDWEPLAKIDTAIAADAAQEKEVSFSVVWNALDDQALDRACWVPSSVCRKRCPQLLLDFYESHMKFSVEN